jgi:hypothetical protein
MAYGRRDLLMPPQAYESQENSGAAPSLGIHRGLPRGLTYSRAEVKHSHPRISMLRLMESRKLHRRVFCNCRHPLDSARHGRSLVKTPSCVGRLGSKMRSYVF